MQEYGNVGRVFGWLEVAFLGLSIVLCINLFLLWAITAARGRGARGLHTFTAPVSMIFGYALCKLLKEAVKVEAHGGVASECVSSPLRMR